MTVRSPFLMLFLPGFLFLSSERASAQSVDNVAVVINEASSVSQRIGDYYVRKRSIPASNVIRIRTSAQETIERAAYASSIEQPIAAALSRNGLQDRILYIVLTKGVPLRIAGTTGVEGSVASVDSELALLYRKMTGQAVPVRGRVANPYYLGTKRIRDAQPFSHRNHDIYLVTRLDAFSVEDVIALIDRAQAPATEGKIVLDQRAGLSDGTGDDWLQETALRLGDLGQSARVVLESTTEGARDIDRVLGYYSWGSNDAQNRVRHFNMKFVPGAIVATFVSTDGRTFQPPPDAWVPSSNWGDRTKMFGGSPQSLIGDLIRDGATGAAGHVAEPYLQSTIRPEILFPVYLAGFNLVESFYLAMPHLSWQTVVVGDPLCTPFPRKVLTRTDLEEPVNPDTELPALFSRRRLDKAIAVSKGTPEKAVALAVLSEGRIARHDNAGAIQALEKGTELAPGHFGSQLQLALLYEQAGRIPAALARYRQILAVQPNNVVVLNNLAYGMAVTEKDLEGALPLAKKAVAGAPNDPTVIDTLAWIEHLRGNDPAAARIMTAALRQGAPGPEIRLHAAIIYAATGAVAAADVQLEEALRLDPSLEKRDDVLVLRARLKKQR